MIGDLGPVTWSWRPVSDNEAFVDADGSANLLSPWPPWPPPPPHTVSGSSLGICDHYFGLVNSRTCIEPVILEVKFTALSCSWK